MIIEENKVLLEYLERIYFTTTGAKKNNAYKAILKLKKENKELLTIILKAQISE